MSEEELVAAYVDGKISRRVFVRRMVAAGLSTAAALSYAGLIGPSGVAFGQGEGTAGSGTDGGYGGFTGGTGNNAGSGAGGIGTTGGGGAGVQDATGGSSGSGTTGGTGGVNVRKPKHKPGGSPGS